MDNRRSCYFAWVMMFCILSHGINGATSDAQERSIPEPLSEWREWATWGDDHAACPTPFNDGKQHLCFWPSRMEFMATALSGAWKVEVKVFEESWFPLPGNDEYWPLQVRDGDDAVAVVERAGVPAVKLSAGSHRLSGTFAWNDMPQRLAIPPQYGIIELMVDGQSIPYPNWDANGFLWLRRTRSDEADKDQWFVNVYRLIEDGIPLWLDTEIELTVTGKSREEELGWALPQGWRLAAVNSPIPVAVDDAGRVKAQVRAGRWTIHLRAFRVSSSGDFNFAEGAVPIAEVELVGFQPSSDFRLAEMEGLPVVDVSQTTYPEKWRAFSVYQWDTSESFKIVEKLRGMGLQQPEGLKISRRFWLDEDGKGLTYRDRIHGHNQAIWRLDVAEGQQPGAIRIDGQGQLITSNPTTNAAGVEIRSRTFQLESVGRMVTAGPWHALGWQTDADALDLTISLPPGWRVLAILGADSVVGDWLTAWTLLDLFLLLIFSAAVFRMLGFVPAVVAFLAFALAYHEPGAARFAWLFLLIPVALLRVIPFSATRMHRLVRIWKYAAVVLLALILIPFVARQVQNAIYPQLERPIAEYGAAYFGWLPGTRGAQRARVDLAADAVQDDWFDSQDKSPESSMRQQRAPGRERGARTIAEPKQVVQLNNLKYDPQARIQTGPAEPEWAWNEVVCHWSGPVSDQQTIRPILIPLGVSRLITIARIVLLLLLAGFIIGFRRPKQRAVSTTTTAVSLAVGVGLVLAIGSPAVAQFPDPMMLEMLRTRLLERPDVYPIAADIASMDLSIEQGRFTVLAEVHAAIETAVPLPGRLPDWSPVSVGVGNEQNAAVRRHDGFLWVVVPAGVHIVRVQGMLPDVTEWECAFLLRPRVMIVNAPGWTQTGINPDGRPGSQVFFSRERDGASREVAYDRRDFQAIVAVERHLEAGIKWPLRTRVYRLSPGNKAISLRIPLLEGEQVVSSNVDVKDGAVEVRLGTDESQFVWESEMPTVAQMRWQAGESEVYVEHWRLTTSPVWNVALDGLQPVFEPGENQLVPVWHPWPGESVALSFSRPQAISGETVTVQRVLHAVSLGNRQRVTNFKLDLDCSLGEDVALTMDPDAEITSLTLSGQTLPVRRDGPRLIVPARPGRQSVEVSWRQNHPLTAVATVSATELPVDAANITTEVSVPASRWVLWTSGPRRGPAVRFWGILIVALLMALILGSLPKSPLSHLEWMLLAIGLTQIELPAALMVVGWLFLLRLRGGQQPQLSPAWRFNLVQVFIVILTGIALMILVSVVGKGLLGNPQMFIVGNGSRPELLRWFEPRTAGELPQPSVVSVSIWFYRLLMLLWALWLATALLRWLVWGWQQFSHGGLWQPMFKK